MNYELLNEKLNEYLEEISKNNNEYDIQAIDERDERKDYYSSYTKEKLLSMNEDELYEYIGKLWAMIIWGNKQYIINKYIQDNGFEKLKQNLAYLLYGKDSLEIRWDNFNKKIKGFGPAMMSELLCYIYPKECMIWNNTSKESYEVLEIKGIPKYNYQLTGAKYLEMTKYSKEINKIINKKTGKDYDLLFVDYFFWDSLKTLENKTQEAEKENKSVINKKSLHTELKEKVKDIGIWLGFDASNEKKIGAGAIVDVVWDFSVNNVGKVTYVFEIQTGGSIDSLIMNLLKASKYKNVQGIIAVSDKMQLETIKKEAEDIFKDSNLKIQYWDQDDVLDVYDKLQSVNESVNKILHIEDSL